MAKFINSLGGSSGATSPTLLDNGTVTAPSYSFSNRPTDGIYLHTTAVLGITLNGSAEYLFNNSGLQLGFEGTAPLPAFRPTSDLNTGPFWAAADTYAISTGGVEAIRFDSTQGAKFAKSAYFSSEVDNGNSGTTDTIDWTAGNKQKSTLTGNVTFTFTAPAGPCGLTLKLVQDATGSRTVTFPSTVKWSGGTAPTLTTAASSTDIVTFYFDGTNYFGTSTLNFS